MCRSCWLCRWLPSTCPCTMSSQHNWSPCTWALSLLWLQVHPLFALSTRTFALLIHGFQGKGLITEAGSELGSLFASSWPHRMHTVSGGYLLAYRLPCKHQHSLPQHGGLGSSSCWQWPLIRPVSHCTSTSKHPDLHRRGGCLPSTYTAQQAVFHGHMPFCLWTVMQGKQIFVIGSVQLGLACLLSEAGSEVHARRSCPVLDEGCFFPSGQLMEWWAPVASLALIRLGPRIREQRQ